METSNQFNPRCVCGGSTENPNADCERCQMLAELARLKSEKEAAERERDEARSQRDRLAGSLVGAIVDYDHQPYQVGDEDYERLCRRPEDGRYVLDAKAVDDIAQVEQWEEAVTWRNLVEQLTAATSRAEALERERDEAKLENAINAADALRAVEIDAVLGQPYPAVVEYSERRKKAIEASDALATIDAYNASWKAQLTAATSRAEALEKGIRDLHRQVVAHSFPGIHRDFVAQELAALLQPAKEVEGGK